jgi:hypothetical protein
MWRNLKYFSILLETFLIYSLHSLFIFKYFDKSGTWLGLNSILAEAKHWKE